MSLTPLVSAEEIRLARSTMLATLHRGCRTFRLKIGWPGGNGEFNLEWNSSERFWVCSEPFPDNDRWVTFFGTDDPTEGRMVGIVCEINPPKEGFDRGCAGVFVRNEEGTILLAHSGKIGGGRKGIGKAAFRSHYRGSWETVAWPDGRDTQVIVIGCIDGERFAAQVGDFVREVERFKSIVTGGVVPPISATKGQPLPDEPQFNDEFSGQRSGYRVVSQIECRCDHGLVINALASTLQAAGLAVANDQNRDLFVLNNEGAMRLLFEAKTDVSTSSIYQGIGQLLYHSSAQEPKPKRVLVLPSSPNDATRCALTRLGISVLVYDWQGSQPVFTNLQQILQSENRL